MTENLDAMRAVEHVPLEDRDTFKAALGATLVKHHGHAKVFETVFEVYFSMFSPGVDEDGESDGGDGEAPTSTSCARRWKPRGAMGQVSNEELAQMLLDALMNMDREQLRMLAGAAVARFAGMEPGRPVGGAYYLYRTLRQLDAEGLVVEDDGRRPQQDQQVGEGAFDERLAREDFEGRLKVLKELIEAEIRRRLVADRGVEAMARTLRKPLPEDVDFMHASREEMQQLQRAIYPLTRALAARLAQRRRHRHRGTLDFRQTIRHSMAYGGMPVEPKFKRPRPSKPEIMVVADISGSVASFARFTLQFVYAMQSEFSKVRSWVFIDGVDEVTRFFDEADEHRRGDPPRQHRGRRRLGRRPLRLRPRVRDVARTPHPRGHEEVVGDPARRRAEQLPRVAGVDARRDAQAGPAAVLARPRAARLLGHRRLDHLRLRAVLRRRLRVPQPPPAPEVRRRRRRGVICRWLRTWP